MNGNSVISSGPSVPKERAWLIVCWVWLGGFVAMFLWLGVGFIINGRGFFNASLGGTNLIFWSWVMSVVVLLAAMVGMTFLPTEGNYRATKWIVRCLFILIILAFVSTGGSSGMSGMFGLLALIVFAIIMVIFSLVLNISMMIYFMAAIEAGKKGKSVGVDGGVGLTANNL